MNSISKHTALQIRKKNGISDAIAFVELLSAIPSKARKRSMKKRDFFNERNEHGFIKKFLKTICDYSGKSAEAFLEKHHCKRKKK